MTGTSSHHPSRDRPREPGAARRDWTAAGSELESRSRRVRKPPRTSAGIAIRPAHRDEYLRREGCCGCPSCAHGPAFRRSWRVPVERRSTRRCGDRREGAADVAARRTEPRPDPAATIRPQPDPPKTHPPGLEGHESPASPRRWRRRGTREAKRLADADAVCGRGHHGLTPVKSLAAAPPPTSACANGPTSLRSFSRF